MIVIYQNKGAQRPIGVVVELWTAGEAWFQTTMVPQLDT